MAIPGLVPGMNVLATALSVIASQEIAYYQNIGRVLNEVGIWQAQYDAPVNIRGSWQLASRQLQEKAGLQYNPNTVVFYCPRTYIQDVTRDRSGDQLIFNGQQYQCLQTPSDWFQVDSWVGIFAVRVPNTIEKQVENDG